MRLEVGDEAQAAATVEPVAPRPRPSAVPASLRAQLSGHYRVPAVRARILEFLGAADGGEPAARFVTTAPAALYRPFSPSPVASLWAAVDRDLELARSLWDRDGLLAHVDIEHVHFDRPWETYASARAAARAHRTRTPLGLANPGRQPGLCRPRRPRAAGAAALHRLS
jgi:hypothetical protein